MISLYDEIMETLAKHNQQGDVIMTIQKAMLLSP
jgi:hypothetical protein